MGGTYRALGLCMEAMGNASKDRGPPLQCAALDTLHVASSTLSRLILLWQCKRITLP